MNKYKGIKRSTKITKEGFNYIQSHVDGLEEITIITRPVLVEKYSCGSTLSTIYTVLFGIEENKDNKTYYPSLNIIIKEFRPSKIWMQQNPEYDLARGTTYESDFKNLSNEEIERKHKNGKIRIAGPSDLGKLAQLLNEQVELNNARNMLIKNEVFKNNISYGRCG